MTLIFFAFSAYLIGSIPFGLLISRWKGIDIRKHGSGNIGATNVFRVIGKKWGITCFVLDALKGYLAVSLPVLLHSPVDLNSSLILAFLAIMGHTFPVWLKFKGGKGVATSLGVFLAAAPFPTLVTFGLWIVIFAVSHIISVASLGAALGFPVIVFLTFPHDRAGFQTLLILSLVLSVFIFYTHRANMRRLIAGEEKRLF